MKRMITETLTALNHRRTTKSRHGNRPITTFDRDVERDFEFVSERRLRRSCRSPETLRLGHVHLRVRNLDVSLAFCTTMLGLRVTERAGRFAFLATSNEHHSIALEEIGEWARNPHRRATGVAHVAFEVPDSEAFAAMRRKLLDAGYPLISRNNGISWAFRFKDPDSNEIEIYVDRRHSPGGTARWGGRWHETPAWEDEHLLITAAPTSLLVA
jgi:catechol 2,3-dioxygenase